MDAGTLDAVTRMNPWLRSPERWTEAVRRRLPVRWVPRRLLTEVASRWRMPDRVHLLVGPRQAGKTTLVWKHLSEIGGRVLFLNAEDTRVRAWCRESAGWVAALHADLGAFDAIFFDEVQHLDDAALFLKGVADDRPGCPVIATGSSAFHLRSRSRESLAGRATRATLLPFALAEVTPFDADPAPAVHALRKEEVFGRHVRFGGYPAVWTGADPEGLLCDLVEAFLQRDASDFLHLRRPDVMNRLVALAARQAGSLVNLSEWAAICGASRDTVTEYLSVLADAHLVEMLPVYAAGGRAELTSSRKAFFLDTGLRNAVLRDFRPPVERADGGALIENWAFAEIRKHLSLADTLHFWRTRGGAEVDFVLARGGASPVGIEVKAGSMRGPQLSRSARSFLDAYRPSRFLVLNGALDHEERVGETTVRWMRFSDFGEGSLGP